MPPKAKVPYGEKLPVLKAELRRLRNEGLKPVSKMKKPEVVAEIDIRKQKKRTTVADALREIAGQTQARNVQRKKDAEEVKGVMDFMKDTLEVRDMVEQMNAPKKKAAKVKQTMPFNIDAKPRAKPAPEFKMGAVEFGDDLY
jgi:hypothetical protein